MQPPFWRKKGWSVSSWNRAGPYSGTQSSDAVNTREDPTGPAARPQCRRTSLNGGPRMTQTAGRRLATMLIALAALAITSAVACGGDSKPEPTSTAPPTAPTATPLSTPTPEHPPTPVPATPTPPEVAASAGSMRDFVMDASTTGRDLTDRLSTTETDCIRAAFGEAIYQIILATPLLQGGSAEDTAVLVRLSGCRTMSCCSVSRSTMSWRAGELRKPGRA